MLFSQFQHGYWIAMKKRVFCIWPCNSLYLYIMSANRQVAWVAELSLIVYMVQFITTQLQLNQNNSFSTIMQFHYNCTHDAIITSLIVIHYYNLTSGTMKILGHFFFQNIDLHCSLWLLMMVRYCDMWHNKNNCYMVY
jgi:hypothetical protein